MWVFAFAAAAGLILSAIVHGTAFAGGNTLSGADYLLGIGVIVIMFPLVMALKREAPASRAMFPVGTPNILKYLGFLLIAYAIFNFFWCLNLLQWGNPVVENGHYFLKDHSRVIKELTVADYDQYRGYERRLFSGHYIALYYFAFVGYYVLARRRSSP